MYRSYLPTVGEGTGAGLPEEFLATRTARGMAPDVADGAAGRSCQCSEESFDTRGVMFTGDFADALVTAPFQDALESPRLDETTGTMVYELSLSGGAISTVSLPDSGKLTQSMIEFPTVYREDASGLTTGGAASWPAPRRTAAGSSSRRPRGSRPRLARRWTPIRPAPRCMSAREGTRIWWVCCRTKKCPRAARKSARATAARLTPAKQGYAYGAIAPDGSNVVFHTPGATRWAPLAPNGKRVSSCATW